MCRPAFDDVTYLGRAVAIAKANTSGDQPGGYLFAVEHDLDDNDIIASIRFPEFHSPLPGERIKLVAPLN